MKNEQYTVYIGQVGSADYFQIVKITNTDMLKKFELRTGHGKHFYRLLPMTDESTEELDMIKNELISKNRSRPNLDYKEITKAEANKICKKWGHKFTPESHEYMDEGPYRSWRPAEDK